MISAIILAAGESRRMGSFKQLLSYGDKTIVETVVDNLLECKIDELVVVLGHRAEEVREVLKDYPIKIAVNDDFRLGMLSSVKCGITKVSNKSNAIIDALGDQPFIKKGIVDRVIDEFLSGDKSIVIPTYERRRGHPVIIDLKYRDEIMNLDDELGLRGLMLDHPDDILHIEMSEGEIIRDMDYPKDYQRELKDREK